MPVTLAPRWRLSMSSLLLLLLLSLPLLGALPVGTTQAPTPRAHAMLLDLATRQPDQSIRIIVQKLADDGSAEAMVERLGGSVTGDLSIIRAFVAQVPASAVPALATAASVRWVSPDGKVERSDGPGSGPGITDNTYLDTTRARQTWNLNRRGEGIGVAVIDSGIVANEPDFSAPGTSTPRIRHNWVRNSYVFDGAFADFQGHGTHVAGIIGGNGTDSASAIQGIAPKVNLIDLNVANSDGSSRESDVIAALQWVFQNKTAYNIRVVNLSLNSSVEASYHTSPLNAAVEILWFNKVVVVVAAGNAGSTVNTINSAPANDPFVITVGASDERATVATSDDVVASFTARGRTSHNFAKPDIIAPGRNIVSVLSNDSSLWATQPNRISRNNQYIRLSGTSMSAPMVTGAVALLLQDEPNLTPDQVKWRLTHTGRTIPISGISGVTSLPYLDVYGTVTGTSTASANTGLTASQLLSTGSNPINWNSVSWNSVSWNSVSWNSVSWNSVSWNSVSWNSVSWND